MGPPSVSLLLPQVQRHMAGPTVGGQPGSLLSVAGGTARPSHKRQGLGLHPRLPPGRVATQQGAPCAPEPLLLQRSPGVGAGAPCFPKPPL